MRTCISCKAQRSKNELIRLVLDAQGQVVPDESGKKAGRGAYVCESGSCLKLLARDRRLNRAFRKEGRIPIHPCLFPNET